MNPEIRRLQYLNGLITQTLDLLNRQQNMLPMPYAMQQGLSHSPWEMINPQMQIDPRLGWTADPRFIPSGLFHTHIDPRFNVGIDPRFINQGLSHTPVDPRYNVSYDPRFIQNVDYLRPVGEIGTMGIQPQFGLSHTPYIPRQILPVPEMINPYWNINYPTNF